MLRKLKQQIRRLVSGPPIHVISFPKCGRTWLRMMLGIAIRELLRIRVRHPLELDQYHQYSVRIPSIHIKHLGDPFNKKPHELTLPIEQLKRSRVLFLIRDPRDVLVSSYFEKSKREGVRLRTADDQYDAAGNFVPYVGSMSDYLHEDVGSLETLLQYYNLVHGARRAFKAYHLLRYEQLKMEPHHHLRTVLRFMGFSNVPEAILNSAVAGAGFEQMRKLEKAKAIPGGRLTPGRDGDYESYKTRRGVIGGYQDYLSPEEIGRINRRMKEKLTGPLGYE